METRKQKFISFLEKISDEYAGGFVGVVMKLPNQDKPELIINVPDSIGNKINYFRTAYNEDLTLITNNEVRIIRYNWALYFDELEDLIEDLIMEEV